MMGLPEKNQHRPKIESGAASVALHQKLQPPREGVLWSIAGFDPSSGAGVTADLMTFAAHGLYGCAAITATTVQNTTGVFASSAADPDQLLATLDRLDEDLPARGIKVGMLASPVVASVVIGWLQAKRAAAQTRPVVVLDPVLRSSSGAVLYPDAGLRLFQEELLPQVDWITPNWPELAVLAETPVNSVAMAATAAGLLARVNPGLHVVATGGDQAEPLDLLVEPGGAQTRVAGEHINTRATHGTGCAFSSALLCALVREAAPDQAVRQAKAYVQGALRHAPGLGKGRGPMELLWPLREPAEDGKGLLP